MRKMKFLLAVFFMIFSVAMTGCGSKSDIGVKSVAICFPNTTPSWQRNAAALQSHLEEDGFTVDVKSSATVEEQQKQIEEALQHKPKCIVIGAIDSAALVDVLEDAKKYEVPVIAFDRIILNTDAVSYYASFDNDAIGEAQALYFEAALNLNSGGGPYNIEFFAGGSADNNAHIFFKTVKDMLDPYLKKGQLVCRSGQTDFNSVAVKDWQAENARPRIRELLSKYYSGGETLHAILAPNDEIAGVILEEIQRAGRPVPLISGLDGDPKAIERIKNGQQTFTIAKDPDVLTAKCFRMVKAVVEGTQPDINDVTTYNNGVKIVPAYLCTPQIVDKTNVNNF
ncbi:MAG: sugar-binding protein [Selenomonadaceae bacterium]|nr:sugar-binding protein [Selenomonadaceae bacterium]